MTHWLDKALEAPVLKLADSAEGLAREDDWLTGKSDGNTR